MVTKRKFNTDSCQSFKNSAVEVITENVSNHPLCLHGPTLLFSSEKGKHFGCSMCRNKKECTIHIKVEDWLKESVKQRNKKYYELIPKIDKPTSWNVMNEVKSFHHSKRAYCVTCKELYVITREYNHSKEHRVITPLTDYQLTHPSEWLPPLENDSVEAQYIFTKKSTSAILGILRNNNIKNIICIGTPSVHEAAQDQLDFDSILLDYDIRYHQFQPPNKYIWYNMFNNYIFNGNSDDEILKIFMKKSGDGICIVIDPPFGGRVEPLVHTLKELSSTYNKLLEKPEEEIVPIIWAFPYFAEPYIRNIMPEMKIHDYQVEYTNHKKFHNQSNKGRKFGSPIRFFTNLHLATIDLSNNKNYKLCDKCKYWVSVNNKHCEKCKECTSKNGMTYKHCDVCKRCVKPTFFHCETCERCCQEKSHACGVVVTSQSCFICHEKGHKKSGCPRLQDTGSKRKRNQL